MIKFRHLMPRFMIGGALMTATVAAHAQQLDISGVWQVENAPQILKAEDGGAPPLKPAFAKAYAAHQAKLKAGNLSFDPSAKCISPGMPRALTFPYPFQIVQGARKVAFLFQWNYWNRLVDLTPGPPKIEYRLYNGYAKGQVRGDALVVDSIGFRAGTLLDSAGLPHSEALEITEEYRLADGGQTLVDRITFTDPGVFSHPWTTVLKFRRLPAGTEIAEDVCLDRTDAGKPAVDWWQR